jgi:hypothetical protein
MSLSDRLRQIIEAVTPATRRFITLEEKTKIKAETWRTWWNRGGKASPDMIQEIGQTWPEYAFWLVTGITDFTHGHIEPGIEEFRHEWISPTYEDKKLAKDIKQRVRSAARDYFLKRIEFEQWAAQPHDRNDIDIQWADVNFSNEIISLSLIREEQEATLQRIEEAGTKEAHKELQEITAQMAEEHARKMRSVERTANVTDNGLNKDVKKGDIPF